MLFGILIEFQRVSFLIMTIASWHRRSFCFCTQPHIRQTWGPPDPPRKMHFQLVSVLWITYNQFDQYWSFHHSISMLNSFLKVITSDICCSTFVIFFYGKKFKFVPWWAENEGVGIWTEGLSGCRIKPITTNRIHFVHKRVFLDQMIKYTLVISSFFPRCTLASWKVPPPKY